MKINFVTTPGRDNYDLLHRWSKELSKRIPDSCLVARATDRPADVNIFVNYALYCPVSTVTMAVFTHREAEGTSLAGVFDNVAKAVDWCFAQSVPTLKFLPPEKSSILDIGIDRQFKKRLRIGLATQNKWTGRKRFEWAATLQKDFGDEIEVVFGGDVPFKDMPAWYDSLDVVLVTSAIEGGPLAIPEGCSRGKLVLTTDVGWARSYPVVIYEDYRQLHTLVRMMLVPATDRLWEFGASQIVSTAKRFLP